MDVDEFWIIFLCNLVWIIRSVRPWCRYCPALCCRYRGSQGEVFFCHSQKQSGLLPHLQMECILPNKLLECKTGYIFTPTDLPRSVNMNTEWKHHGCKIYLAVVNSIHKDYCISWRETALGHWGYTPPGENCGKFIPGKAFIHMDYFS